MATYDIPMTPELIAFFDSLGVVMASPVVSASLNAASYPPGATATLTVNYSDPDNRTDSLTITATDSAGNPASTPASLVISDPVTLTVTDSSGRVWTKISDNGAVAVFTAVV